MNNKKIIISMVTAALLLTSCADPNQNESKNLQDLSPPVLSVHNQAPPETLDYETIGDIIEIKPGQVHVLTGDIAQVFTVSQDTLDSYYLGQSVYVQKTNDDTYTLKAYEKEDFSINHTNMGHLITRYTGSLVSSTGETAVLDTNLGQITVSTSTDVDLKTETSYEFDIIHLGEDDMFLSAAYDLDGKLSLEITKLTRLDTGQLQVEGRDHEAKEYILNTSYPTKNFNLTDLEIGQNINVYALAMDESTPQVIEASRLDLIVESTPVSQEDTYEAIGQVVAIDDKEVHLLQGDVIEIFRVQADQLVNIYMGQTVRLFGQEDLRNIEPYIITDFSSNHTSMGIPIDYRVATVTSIKTSEESQEITVTSDKGQETYIYYGDGHLEEGKLYEFETMSYSDNLPSIIDFFDPETIIEVKVTALSRSLEGVLMVQAKDNDGGEYTLSTSGPSLNFNLSQLEINDTLDVYVDALMESWPMQVDSRKINKK